MDLSDGALRLENVTLRSGDPENPALKNLTLVARPGRVTALTGSDGASASTLLAVALGLVRPDEGRVTVGGVELDDLDPAAWWTNVAWVPQRPALVAGTIAENIRLGWSASDAQVADAASAAALDDVRARLPLGLDTMLGEDGAGLSAGERQRVGLARAFLRNSAVVLLDEPTADPDEELLGALRRLMAGRTVLMVAHRPALLALADDVVVLPELVPA